jgi:hypothetical protein
MTLIISCEKIPFDFRNKYLGRWEFDVTNSHLTFNTTQGFHDTTSTIRYYGEINYGSNHGSIMFQSIGYNAEFSIDDNGKIIPLNVNGPNYSESGGFEGSRIFRYNYYHHMGASREYTGIEIYGVKD